MSDIFSTSKSFESYDYSSHDTSDIEDESFGLRREAKSTLENGSFSPKIQRVQENISLERLKEVDNEGTKFREKLLKLEMDKFEWSKEMDKKKLELERLRIEKEFELKKMELQQNERIKMYEIEMKYKNDK